MMDFMDSLRRGVDKAGFEMDRLLRANRVRGRINTVRSQIDEEERRIGHRAVELHQRGDLAQEELREGCERVSQLQSGLVQLESELDAINREAPPEETREAEPEVARCPNCGTRLPEDAVYCPRCGASLKVPPQAPRPQPEEPAEAPPAPQPQEPPQAPPPSEEEPASETRPDE